jgi:hypothetical protein
MEAAKAALQREQSARRAAVDEAARLEADMQSTNADLERTQSELERHDTAVGVGKVAFAGMLLGVVGSIVTSISISGILYYLQQVRFCSLSAHFLALYVTFAHFSLNFCRTPCRDSAPATQRPADMTRSTGAKLATLDLKEPIYIVLTRPIIGQH